MAVLCHSRLRWLSQSRGWQSWDVNLLLVWLPRSPLQLGMIPRPLHGSCWLPQIHAVWTEQIFWLEEVLVAEVS